ncbi:MAG TPA: FAD-dependent oxidoreductase [Acetobacteraceae bacterium]|nr:FAD-dependent oxidoreductase [Acetobacteraceae bacterium]HUB47389.1 FAD-dependent oxidoreductase [Acetobacteraceae bacterium]
MNMLSRLRCRLVIVGNGMAGVMALEEILARAPRLFDITVFGAEAHGSYNRILLSPVLAGEMAFADIVTHDAAWYAENHVEQIAGEAVVEIDRAARNVRGAHGTIRPYDLLLLATGSNPVVLPIPGAGLPGVFTFRDIADVGAMRAASRTSQRAVVIGGGLLGLEAAHGLCRNGMSVTVVHLMPGLMERQLDAMSANLLAQAVKSRGIAVLTSASTAAVLGEDRVTGVALTDGRSIPADMVVMAAGTRPRIAVAREARLACGRGVRVDDAMRTSDPCIYAIGECAEHDGVVVGLVAPIRDMARVFARHAAGDFAAQYAPAVAGTHLKVSGIDTFSAGDFLGDDTTEAISFRDKTRGVHRRLVLRDDRLVGIAMVGDARDSGWYFDLLRRGADVSAMRDMLAFGAAA